MKKDILTETFNKHLELLHKKLIDEGKLQVNEEKVSFQVKGGHSVAALVADVVKTEPIYYGTIRNDYEGQGDSRHPYECDKFYKDGQLGVLLTLRSPVKFNGKEYKSIIKYQGVDYADLLPDSKIDTNYGVWYDHQSPTPGKSPTLADAIKSFHNRNHGIQITWNK